MLTALLLYLVLGSVAGVVAGLFGIGGGLLIVPVLIFSFELQGMSAEVLTHSAVATSLATIVVTSISSMQAHHQRGAVRWELFRPLTVGIIAGAAVGAMIASLLSGAMLQLVFGLFVLAVAVQMALSLKPDAGERETNPVGLAGAGSIIGGLSAIFGIGGGTLSVPYLSWRRVCMQQAVATSAACGLPIALSGALTNIWTGWDNPALSDWSLGYVYLPAFAGIVLTSTLFARLGAKLAHSLDGAKLKKFFAVFLVLVGTRLLITNLMGN
ncbi:MAG: sulfite exporter TauE/SafE family protein [Marinobacterium sp.]|nr:sulfite exporter TauE/SafE family protein [Marinobacterium sp.]